MHFRSAEIIQRERRRSQIGPVSWCALTVGLLISVIVFPGCKPSKYRQMADRDAYCLEDEKSAMAGLLPPHYGVYADPRSRMFDPNNPDNEPMPPDDPTANLLMQCIDGKKGSPKWKRLPKTLFVENPGWLESVPTNEEGQVVLDLKGAVEMALIDSPRYQSEIEELYLSALDVSFERFRFDCQFFQGSSVFITADGERRSGTGSPSTIFEVSPLRPGNSLHVERLTATGGQLVAGLANSLVWQFAGNDDYSGNTLLDFTFVQPLLRAGGRTRVLERLTISERNLLGNVREMARFRKAFYVSVVTGGDPGQGPSRRGGFFGGSGLQGFTGVGGGGFGRVGGGFGGGGGGGGFTGGAGAQGSGGYLGLLQNEQVLSNQYANAVSLNDSVRQLEATYEAGRIDRFQVDLARQALFNAQSQLLTGQTQYQSFLESFLTGLGLPPELRVKIDDPMIDHLRLLDPELETLRGRVSEVLDELRLLRDAPELIAADPDEELVVPNLFDDPANDTAAKLEARLVPIMEEIRHIEKTTTERLAVVREDFAKLSEILPERRQALERLATRPELVEASVEIDMFSVKKLDERVTKQVEDLDDLEARLLKVSDDLAKFVEEDRPVDREMLVQFSNVLTELSSQLLELSLAQAGARLETISFEPVELTMEQALAIAAEYRLDWKNARANLVDSWRLIYFNANDLRSDLNVFFSGDLSNVGDNPFRLRGTNGRLRAGFQFDSPLTRLAERNIYRQSLIEYQQARRSYYQYRDGVYLNLRNILRQIHLNELNFELRRAAVHVAISQVELTQLRLSEPPKPGETAEFANTTARDLVQALGDLLNVQNDFLSVWINYEVQRLNLELDLGVMEVDSSGLRIENPVPLETYLIGLPCNTTDMGLAAEGNEWFGTFESMDGESLPPVEPLSEEISEESGYPHVEPLPIPNVQESIPR
ncbi:TolC family protein [Bythopirellula goksoeyrii]|uniref:Outer membrane efflux protein n=1 Tax=Bythopirellula goksoeyrii TaxID=1400387 RepID=A0A5B9QD35_9BACT|nr:TolC family protein [Bythopirellula goksoeyrii]QEG34856.1 Outer membrane efflux protein [Bythopirellula goksoeyrii]